MSEGDAGSTLKEAERKGFVAGLNVGLLSIGVVCVLAAVVRSLYALPWYKSVFTQVKVPMPGLTLLVFEANPFVVTFLLLGSVACVAATWVRGHRRQTLVMNAVLLSASLVWIMLSVLATQLPFVSVHEGIGDPRR